MFVLAVIAHKIVFDRQSAIAIFPRKARYPRRRGLRRRE